MVLWWNYLKYIPLSQRSLRAGILLALVSWTFYGDIPIGVFIISRWLGCIKTANVSLATFLPANYSFLTTQWGVASR